MAAFNKLEKYMSGDNPFIEKFKPQSKNFLIWQNNFEYLMDLYEFGYAEKLECLLKLMEPSILKSIEEKLAPKNPFLITYDMIIDTIYQLYCACSRKEAAYSRFLFRDQIIGETITQYVLALRKLSSLADHRANTPDVLRDRFIEGLNDEEIQYKLRNEKDLTFTKAISIAQQMDLQKKKNIEILKKNN
ncbi:hypothetical protein M0802_014576 [Mischocyttarus mexicanus]|nr:hypothetical protein M0802_014576 [Mischocyttarus mexicanus]